MFVASVLVVLSGGVTYNALHNHNDCAGFLPENNLKIPVSASFTNDGGLTEDQFNEVIDRVESVYTDIVAETGNTLEIERYWSSEDVNASAIQIGNIWRVRMYGGLARHSAIGVEAFATVLCHELGHHLGGAPKKTFMRWASNEGQSDYYASSKCMRKLYTEDENSEYINNVELDEYAKSACDYVFGSDSHKLANCYRSAKAGQDIAIMFQDLESLSAKPEFNTPSTKVTESTNHNHPKPQCRLDTYFHGALCDTSKIEGFDDSDPTIGACNRSADLANVESDLPADIGTRPLCWFKPSINVTPTSLANL